MKITCDARCQKCYHSKGRVQDLDLNDLILFCSGCKRKYLCDVGVNRTYRGNTQVFTCPHCSAPLVKEEVDKSVIKSNYMQTELFNEPGEISTVLISKISELTDIKHLSPDILFQIALDYNIDNINTIKKMNKSTEILNYFAKNHKDILEFLYHVFINFDDSYYAFKTRFAVFYTSKLKGKSKLTFVNPNKSQGKIDLKVTTSSGDIWVYCLPKDIDVPNIEEFAEKLLSVEKLKKYKISQVFFVAKSYSFTSIKMFKKYKPILSALDEYADDVESIKSVPITLFYLKKRKSNDFKSKKL